MFVGGLSEADQKLVGGLSLVCCLVVVVVVVVVVDAMTSPEAPPFRAAVLVRRGCNETDGRKNLPAAAVPVPSDGP